MSGLTSPRGGSPKPSSKSHAQAETLPQAAATDHNFSVGDNVLVSGSKLGVVRFLGSTQFAKGEWAGVELNVPEGKNDGSVGGVHYFTCKPLHGVFAKPQKLERAPRQTPKAKVENALPRSVPRSSVSSASESDSSLVIGDKVLVGGAKSGTLRYVGTTAFAQGVWAGVELDEALGKNDGAVAGKR